MILPGQELARRWRQEAEGLRRRGLAQWADFQESLADDLEAEVRRWELEELPVSEAAVEVGKSASQIRRDVGNGKLRNVAGSGPIKVRRGDLLQLHQGG